MITVRLKGMRGAHLVAVVEPLILFINQKKSYKAPLAKMLIIQQNTCRCSCCWTNLALHSIGLFLSFFFFFCRFFLFSGVVEIPPLGVARALGRINF